MVLSSVFAFMNSAYFVTKQILKQIIEIIVCVNFACSIYFHITQNLVILFDLFVSCVSCYDVVFDSTCFYLFYHAFESTLLAVLI